jgi:hypothetical protein
VDRKPTSDTVGTQIIIGLDEGIISQIVLIWRSDKGIEAGLISCGLADGSNS